MADNPMIILTTAFEIVVAFEIKAVDMVSKINRP